MKRIILLIAIDQVLGMCCLQPGCPRELGVSSFEETIEIQNGDLPIKRTDNIRISFQKGVSGIRWNLWVNRVRPSHELTPSTSWLILDQIRGILIVIRLDQNRSVEIITLQNRMRQRWEGLPWFDVGVGRARDIIRTSLVWKEHKM